MQNEELQQKVRKFLESIGVKKGVLVFRDEPNLVRWVRVDVGPHEAMDMFEVYKYTVLNPPVENQPIIPPVKV